MCVQVVRHGRYFGPGLILGTVSALVWASPQREPQRTVLEMLDRIVVAKQAELTATVAQPLQSYPVRLSDSSWS